MKRLLQLLKQRFCKHEVYADLLTLDNDADLDSRVKGDCCKCGKTLCAPYGIALPLRWDKPPASRY